MSLNRESDPVDAGPSGPATTTTPWTPDELAAAQAWAQQYYTSHKIPNTYGTVQDLVSQYQQQRAAGLDHNAAMGQAPVALGWDKYAPDPGAPPPQSTGGAPPPPAPAAGPAPPPGGPIASAYLGAAGLPANGTAPTFTAADYTPPPPLQAPPAFSYADFVAPDPSQLNQDPLFNYTLKTQQDAIQKGAAARGILNTGGTIYDLLSNAKDIASTGYADLFNRNKSVYDTNRAGAFDAYKTNYGIGKDVYDTNAQQQNVLPYQFGYQGTTDRYNSLAHNFDLGQSYAWANNLFNFSKDQDAFDRKYRLLSLA